LEATKNNPSQAYSFTVTAGDNYILNVSSPIEINITTDMLGKPFSFITIGWSNVPYKTNLLGFNSTDTSKTQTVYGFPSLPSSFPSGSNYPTYYLESGYWNGNNFVNTQSILGHYGNAIYCMLYGDISDCIGFYEFMFNGQALSTQSYSPFFNAYVNNQNLSKLYQSGGPYNIIDQGNFSSEDLNYLEYGLYYYTSASDLSSVPIGYFYPNYTFYSSDINLSNYLTDAINSANITAYYGYYIPVYQASGVCNQHGLFGPSCSTNNPSSVLNMVSDAESNNYYYQFIQNFLYFATSTSSISFSFPNYIPIIEWINYTIKYSNGAQQTSWSNKVVNYTTLGYSQTLLKTNQSVGYSPIQNGVSLIPQIPTSGSEANIFAFNNTH